MSDYQNQQQEFTKTAFNNRDVTLWAKNQEDAWANMIFAVETTGRKKHDNVFAIKVFTRVSTEEKKPITALLDVGTFGIFTKLLRDTIAMKLEPGKEYKAPVIESLEQKWTKGENGRNIPDGTYVNSRVHLGKDAEGKVWIAVTSGKRNNIKFIFHKNKMVNLRHSDGSPLSDAELSILSAHSFLTMFEKWTYQLLIDGYKEPSDNGYGNSSSNNINRHDNYNNGGQQNNQSSGSSNNYVPDDDIPF